MGECSKKLACGSRLALHVCRPKIEPHRSNLSLAEIRDARSGCRGTSEVVLCTQLAKSASRWPERYFSHKRFYWHKRTDMLQPDLGFRRAVNGRINAEFSFKQTRSLRADEHEFATVLHIVAQLILERGIQIAPFGDDNHRVILHPST